MNDTIERLRSVLASKSVAVDAHDVFELLEVESCTQCCTKSDGGNASCPPPKLQ